MEHRNHSEKSLDVVILAAGLGTRMKSRQAKVLHKLGGHPLIAHACRTAATLNPHKIYVVVGHQAERSEEHTSELQSLAYLVCRLLLEKKKKNQSNIISVQNKII